VIPIEGVATEVQSLYKIWKGFAIGGISASPFR